MKLKKYLILSLIIFIPIFFLYIFSSGKSNIRKLQYFGKSKAEAKNNKIKDFIYYDKDSNIYDKHTLKNKHLIVSTIIETCPNNCNILLSELKFIVYDKMKNEPEFLKNFMFISVASDTNENKNINLNQILENFDEKLSNWIFVKGNENSIYDFDLPNGNILKSKTHSNYYNGKEYYRIILLIDKNHNVRGIYQADNALQLKNLLNDCKVLQKEFQK